MDENEVITSQDTEVVAEREQPEARSIGEVLKANYRILEAVKGKDDETVSRETPVESETLETVETTQPEKPLLVPPSDMRADEREAFLNPSPANAHVLQEYVNRRAYETRSEWQKRMVELEDMRKQHQSVHEVLNEYKDSYAKNRINMGDLVRQSITWDRAMQEDPVATALDWLDAYGLSVEDLVGRQPGVSQPQPQQGTPYLTREEAERIAEEKYQAIQAQQQMKAVEFYNTKVVESFVQNKPLFRDPETASQLEAEMAPIVAAFSQTGRYSSPEEILEKAYTYVVQGNPTFSSIVNKMRAKEDIVKEQQKAQKAKAASKSVSGSHGSGSPTFVSTNLRENLERRFAGG